MLYFTRKTALITVPLPNFLCARFRIPDIVLDPPLSEVQMTVDEIVESITAAARGE